MKALPLWIAVPITVVVSLPFGLWLGVWSLPLWAAFIVWAEYFQLGAKPAALKLMVPGFIAGAIGAGFVCAVSLAIGKILGNPTAVSAGDIPWFIGMLLAFIPVIYAMKYLPFTAGPGGLCFFNGISMGLATFFVGLYAGYGGMKAPDGLDYLLPVITTVPAILAGLLGAFLGWFNVVIMTPWAKEPQATAAGAKA
ncbi:MAG: hypothetical protein ACYDAN_09305 [Candidatus Limnocylindrales bacterium]